MKEPGFKQQVMLFLRDEQAEEQKLIDALSSQERAEEGTFEQWTLKDTLAHAAAWNLQYVSAYLEELGAEVEAPGSDLNQTNRSIYDTCKNYSWEELNLLRQKAGEIALQVLEKYSDEALRAAQAGKRAPFIPLVGAAAWHPLMHLADYLNQAGRGAEATALMERYAARLRALDPDPVLQGMAYYDLGCIYIKTGREEEALGVLGQAFSCDAGLKDWAQQDPDLAAVRDKLPI